MRVQLYLVGGGSITRKVHRLVAQHFIPNPEAKSQVNHIDGNKKDNAISNLEWVTNSENMKHAVATGLQRNRPDVYALAPQMKYAIDRRYLIEDIARLQGTTVTTIKRAIRGVNPAKGITTLKVGRRKHYVYFDKSRGKWRTELRTFGISNAQFNSREEAESHVDLALSERLQVTGPLAPMTDEHQRP